MKTKSASLDHILEKYVGGVGKYQIFITIILYHVRVTFSGIYHVFTAYPPDHRCRIELCEATNQSKVRKI